MVKRSMGLPQLETCCFIFDLKTGNLILGGLNVIVSFTLTVIMISYVVSVGQIEPTGDVDLDAPVTGLYVMCILLTLMFLVRFLSDVYFLYGVIIEKASIIKAYFIVWIIILIMSTSIFFLNIQSFNAGTIFTECVHLGANIYTILLSHSFYKQLNCREEV